jgi:hypothetical protein
LEFEIQLACQLVIFVCVACILGSPRVPPGILEAGKIAPQANAVNSGVRTGGKNADRFASAVITRERRGMATINWSDQFFVLPRTRAFPFFSQENFFSRPKNKIHFFLVDFETDF